MFLNRVRNVGQRMRDGEQGAAMIAVIGLMIVAMLLTTLISSSVISGLGQATAARAGVQSQASADAGIAVARAGLSKGTCVVNSGVYQSAAGDIPKYSAAIWRPKAGGGWEPGCPGAAAASVLIRAEGTAASLGVAGQSSGDKNYVEAVYAVVPTTGGVVPGGAAIYAYSSGGFSGAGTLTSGNGSKADVQVRNGNVTCDGGSKVVNDIIVYAGTLDIKQGCVIKGTAWSSGNMTIDGGIVLGGDAVSSGTLTITDGPTINGNVWSAGDMTVSGGTTIKGNVSSGGKASLSSGSVQGSVWSVKDMVLNGGVKITGDAVSGGALNLVNGTVSRSTWSSGTTTFTSSSHVSGKVTVSTPSGLLKLGGGDIGGDAWAAGTADFPPYKTTISGKLTARTVTGGVYQSWNGVTLYGNAGGGIVVTPAPGPGAGPAATIAPVKPTAPSVADWVDFDYDKTQWAGFNETIVSGNCTFAVLQSAAASVGSGPGIIDARTCTGGVTIGSSDKLLLSNDLVIVAKNFSLGEGGGFKATSERKLWLINPDTVKDGKPSCGTGSFSVGGGFTVDNVTALIYSPCQVVLASGLNWRGQVFAGAANISGGATLSYVPLGLPGVDLGTGAPSGGGPASVFTPGALVSMRDVQ